MRVAAAVLLLAAALNAAPLRWTPAGFRGLVMGLSRQADVIRLLGPPDRTSRTPAAASMRYRGRGDHGGDLTIRIEGRSRTVTEIQESFAVAIPRSRIYKELGRDAVSAHYSKNKCGDFYRDPQGPIELTLYPALGIYLWPDQYGYDFAAIYYAARPPGAARPRPCASRK
jgi:hypothetical protein